MTPFQRDLTIYQGADFDLQFTWKINGVAVSLTGYTARLQVRDPSDGNTILLSLTTENGGIVLGGAAGTYRLVRSAAQTAALDFVYGPYDLELVSSGGVVGRRQQGKVFLSREVTR